MDWFDSQVFYQTVAAFLRGYYAVLALLNGGAAVWAWRDRRRAPAWLWLAMAGGFAVLAALSASADPRLIPSLPEWLRTLVNAYVGPVVYCVGTTCALVVLYRWRRFFVRPAVAWLLLNAALLILGLSMPDEDFYAIVAKPDNVPIVGLVFLLGYFTWLGASQAVRNDERLGRGLPPQEQEANEPVLVWPDLVYIELICMVAVTALLIIWGMALKAPLEDAASSVKTPNPSKAPWYFLGLQEMLVYFDAWLAGVVLPSLVVLGLLAIPYLDVNRAGNGYYTIAQRRFSYLVFQVGFLLLWTTLIVLGTFLRGPNWDFFGPYEAWDVPKAEPLNNVNLAEYFWHHGLGRTEPKAPSGSGLVSQMAYIVYREAPGILLLLLYFLLVPPLLARTVLKRFLASMGRIRFAVMVTLLLLMALLPIKMVLRWTIHLQYFVSIPEFLLNL